MVGEEMARVWRLYLVGGGLSFEEGRMGVDQFLAVRPSAHPANRPVCQARTGLWHTYRGDLGCGGGL